MQEIGVKNPKSDLSQYGLKSVDTAYWNLTPAELVEHTLNIGEGVLTDTGAIAIRTGKFTGRSPDDKFTVKDANTETSVDWSSKFNIPFTTAQFDALHKRVLAYLENRKLYVVDAVACADPKYRIGIRLIAEKPWSAMFAVNMFINPSNKEIQTANPDWIILNAPGFMADPAIDGTRQSNFAAIDFTKKIILIGGTGYTGEIKKGIFTILNYTLPLERNVFPMHCSANQGKDGDTAIFFGLSGTGKTTLSADPNRSLIGDDEHGWSEEGVFNFEGGCYAKTINLSPEGEPEIYEAIKFGAILENIGFVEGTRTPDYAFSGITENTRVSYPLEHIPNALQPSVGNHPKNIFFLTCDAYGVLPPISKLTPGQAMHHFISGYTARVAGTEAGVTEPKPAFSQCFGAPFLPLHPVQYATMLSDRMQKHKTNIWLVNTGWSGGQYGVGSRMKLRYTRAMIQAALEGKLQNETFETLPIFGLEIPKNCPEVPTEILNPRNTWADKTAYDKQAIHLANLFNANFEKFASLATEEILAAAPKVGALS
jgi:phosphoenolpyruvate carboxykinase (ATP)